LTRADLVWIGGSLLGVSRFVGLVHCLVESRLAEDHQRFCREIVIVPPYPLQEPFAMKSVLRKLTTLAFGLAVMAMAQPASAAFNGFLGFSATTGVSGGTLLTQNSYTFTDLLGTTPAVSIISSSGGFAGIPVLTSFASSTLNLANLVGFTLSNGTYGTFTSINNDGMGDISEVLSHSGNFVDVYLIGNYSGGAVGATPVLASLRLSINYSGGPTATVAATLAAPPATIVPEPASLAMVVMGLASVGGLAVSRRRRQTV
jgi:hypothetical protein